MAIFSLTSSGTGTAIKQKLKWYSDSVVLLYILHTSFSVYCSLCSTVANCWSVKSLTRCKTASVLTNIGKAKWNWKGEGSKKGGQNRWRNHSGTCLTSGTVPEFPGRVDRRVSSLEIYCEMLNICTLARPISVLSAAMDYVDLCIYRYFSPLKNTWVGVLAVVTSSTQWNEASLGWWS